MSMEQASRIEHYYQSFKTNSLPDERDGHSFSNPHQVRVRYLELALDVLFEEKSLHGTAILSIDRYDISQPLILDTMDLRIVGVETSADGITFLPTEFSLGQSDPILGTPLTIQLPEEANRVRVEYSTDPGAIGLQWLSPAQTAGKKSPFMFTQSQTIYARSWIPLQDSPQVRVIYHARVRTPSGLLAVMGAANNAAVLGDGEYEFLMPQPIPSYLIALAVGELVFEPVSHRSGIYAEPAIIESAVREFADVEQLMAAAEKLYGPYAWDRYDILVLPPSFPLGGMENPRLTFVTPTILAGDKSMVSLIVHEMAHSWSGNLVSNATWSDFWLNEGFTVYVERRILEEVYGKRREEMEAALGRQDLKNEFNRLDERYEILHIDLKDHDPEDCFTKVPYEKGVLFLRQLEETFGRARFDQFLRDYFARFAFQSITTADFIAYLKENLSDQNPKLIASVPVTEWIYYPGLPDSAPRPNSDAFAEVEKMAKLWLRETISLQNLPTSLWTTHEWLHFLRFLPQSIEAEKMRRLDGSFNLTNSGNSEIAHQWLLMAIRNNYEPAFAKLEEYLTSIGREKLIRPLYEELIKAPEGQRRAEVIYARARSTYHPLVVAKLDRLLGLKTK